jgi:hypothetical protein
MRLQIQQPASPGRIYLVISSGRRIYLVPVPAAPDFNNWLIDKANGL